MIICFLFRPTPEPVVEPVVTAPVESEVKTTSDESISKPDETDGAKVEPGNNLITGVECCVILIEHIFHCLCCMLFHYDYQEFHFYTKIYSFEIGWLK